MKLTTRMLVFILILGISTGVQATEPLRELLGLKKSKNPPLLLLEFSPEFQQKPLDHLLHKIGKDINLLISDISNIPTIAEQQIKSSPTGTNQVEQEKKPRQVITKKRNTPAPIVKPSLFRTKTKDHEA